jgi:hypothetical protein
MTYACHGSHARTKVGVCKCKYSEQTDRYGNHPRENHRDPYKSETAGLRPVSKYVWRRPEKSLWMRSEIAVEIMERERKANRED